MSRDLPGPDDLVVGQANVAQPISTIRSYAVSINAGVLIAANIICKDIAVTASALASIAGVKDTDYAFLANGPAVANALAVSEVRASTAAFVFTVVNPTAASASAASGTYTVLLMRPTG